MKIVIIGQEEPVYFGPFFRKIIEARSSDIALVVIAGKRGAGSHPKTFFEKLKNIYSLWLPFEPFGFCKNLTIKCFQKFLSFCGLIGTKYDKRSIQGIAKELNIPFIFVKNINSSTSHTQLKSYSPDIIINQSELLIKKELLNIPKVGILNRHASLLPRFRGRVGSFWGHAEEFPEYGVTIHLIDEKIDSGPIILQKKYDLNHKLSYAKILDSLFNLSVPLMLDALKKLGKPNFSFFPNNFQRTLIYRFPSIKQIKKYRKILKKRRKSNLSNKII